MVPYALRSWDATSDALAWATLAIIAQSDWDEWLELVDLQQEAERQPETRVGMGGGPGDTNVDDSNSTNLVSRYQELEDHVTSEFGIQIEWGGESNDMKSRLTQLQNLDRAIDYIVYYLTWRVYDGDERRALADWRIMDNLCFVSAPMYTSWETSPSSKKMQDTTVSCPYHHRG